MLRAPLIGLVMLLLAVTAARAQGNLPAERSSLAGISSFIVEVTVEGPTSLAESLGQSTLTHRVQERLRERGMPIVSTGGDHPKLNIHLNLMELGNGLIPFSIEVGFYQSVLLARNRDRMDAETWSESVVGLVSPDRIRLIEESVDGLIEQFAQDFEATN